MHLTFESKVAQSPKYRPEIDGLRAIAILPVLLYHAGVRVFSGGFVGVDVFYVISGYLITSIIFRDIDQEKFSIVSFYDRRIRRIFPALFTVALFCLAVTAIMYSPRDLTGFGKSLIAMTAFVSNIYFRRTGGDAGYFGKSSDIEPLLHTWSLSVEEQFYIFFPIMLLLLHRWARRHELACLSAAIVLSFVLSTWGAVHRPQGTFYLLPPRSWELLIGSLLAMGFVPEPRHRVVREIAGLAGTGLIAWAVFMFTDSTKFPGANALFPCLGAWLIIYSGANGPSTIKRILSLRPVVFIGVVSYSLYLWHWPIIVFSKYFLARELSSTETGAVIALSIAMAFLSFEFIESPFRGKGSPITRRQIFSFGGAASAAALVFGLLLWSSHGLPQRFNENEREIVTNNSDRETDFHDMSECSNWKREIHSVADIALCRMGSSSKNIIFWGDSHVEQLYPLVQKIFADGKLGDRGAFIAAGPGCLPSEHMNGVKLGFHCNTFTHYAMVRAQEDDIDTVFIGFATWLFIKKDEAICLSANDLCVNKISHEEAERRFIEEMTERIRILKAKGKRVIISLPFPAFDRSIPQLLIHNVIFGPLVGNMPVSEVSLPNLRDQIASMAKNEGADVFDPRQSLCHDQNCIFQINGVSIYKDDHHISASQIGILGENLVQVLQ